MLDIHALDMMIKDAGVTTVAVTRMAELHPRYIARIRNGEFKLTPNVASRIKLAIGRLKRGEKNPGEDMTSGSYRLAIAYVALHLQMKPEAILAADPGRRATADKEWLEASRARRWAIYIANQYLGVRQAELARAAGMSKAAISIAMNDVEDERGNKDLELLLQAVEGAFSL